MSRVVLSYHRGDIFKSCAPVLVNPVNCVGVMGAGLAKQFAIQYPEILPPYREDCENGLMYPGSPQIYPTVSNEIHTHVICAPTKVHWMQKSSRGLVEATIRGMAIIVSAEHITHLATPKLGCGLGGLDWDASHQEDFWKHRFSDELYMLRVDHQVYVEVWDL